MYQIEELENGKFISTELIFGSEEDMLQAAEELFSSGEKSIFVCYPDGQKLRYPEGMKCKSTEFTRKLGNEDYRRAIARHSTLNRNGIRPRVLVDVHWPDYRGNWSWKGPYEVSSIASGGRVALKGERGNFSWCRVRIHQEECVA